MSAYQTPRPRHGQHTTTGLVFVIGRSSAFCLSSTGPARSLCIGFDGQVGQFLDYHFLHMWKPRGGYVTFPFASEHCCGMMIDGGRGPTITDKGWSEYCMFQSSTCYYCQMNIVISGSCSYRSKWISAVFDLAFRGGQFALFLLIVPRRLVHSSRFLLLPPPAGVMTDTANAAFLDAGAFFRQCSGQPKEDIYDRMYCGMADMYELTMLRALPF